MLRNTQLAEMQKRKETQQHIRIPDLISDNLNRGKLLAGAKLYATYCGKCHQDDGKRDGTRFPPIESSEWVRGDKSRLYDRVNFKNNSSPVSPSEIARERKPGLKSTNKLRNIVFCSILFHL